MEVTVFNPTQIHLLKMFSLDKTDWGVDEMKNVLYEYYSRKMNSNLNRLWDSGVLNQDRLDAIDKQDLHQL